MTPSRPSSKLRVSFRARVVAVAAMLVLVAACEEGANPLNTAQTSAAGGPAIAAVEANPLGNGIVSLKVTATDADRSPLTFAWKVSDGQLASSTSANVQWRVPKAAGTYVATIEVSNAKGVKAIGSQSFTVDANGKATAAGQLQVAATGATASSTAGRTSGQFAIPQPVGSQQAAPPIVSGNIALPGPTPTPQAPLTQPVATPAPAIVRTPIPLQPIATPTPSPPPLVLPLPVAPTPVPPPPEAGVPETPPVTWRRYDPGKVPSSAVLTSVHFLDENTGFIAGGNGTVMAYNKVGTADPALTLKSPIPAVAGLSRIRMVNAQKGFIAGIGGLVMRTLDGGTTWQDIHVPDVGTEMTGLVVFNEQIVLVGDNSGRVWRTGAANAVDPANVFWVQQPTRPALRPAESPAVLLDGAGFNTDPTVTYWVGDGIYKLDSDLPDQGMAWTRMLQLQTDEGVAQSIEVISTAEIWVGTSSGNLLRTADGGSTWTRLGRERFFNREHNGNELGTTSQFLPVPGTIRAMSGLNGQNVFMATQQNVFDTRDGGTSWRRQNNTLFYDLQMMPTTRNGKPDFVGWAVGLGGMLQIYAPPPP